MALGRISDDDIAKVREATDLVALVGERSQMRQKGREFWCCCPLHHEKTPSFKIDPASQLWHCFGCGEGGDVFGFVMKADELTFPEAVRKLAERAHIDIAFDGEGGYPTSKKQRLKEVCAGAAAFYHRQLMRGADEASAQARTYLASRGLGGEVPKKWQLGFAPGQGALVSHLTYQGFTADEMVEANVAVHGRDGRLRDRFFSRVIFPITDAGGEVIAFGGRVIGSGEPKYLNSQETPIFHKAQVLFGLDKAKAQMASTGTAIVTEGYTDVIAMHQAGIENTVATLGTALTKNHIRTLSRHAGKRIVYIFDGDAAGQRATERALQFIDESITPESGTRPLEICALCLPEGQDPAEYLASHTPEEMRALIAGAPPLILFGIERRLARHDRGTAEGRASACADALAVLAPIKDSILAKDYAVQIANMLRLREDDVLAQLARTKRPPTYAGEGDAGSAEEGGTPFTPPAQTLRLSLAERNRLDLEREFLGRMAQNPTEALAFGDALESVHWHDKAHFEIASSISATLMDKLDATPAEVVERAVRVCPQAASILTSAGARDESSPHEALRFLADELAIGDTEDELANLRSRLALGLDDEEAKRLFEQTVVLQDRLTSMKNRRSNLA